MFPLFKYRLTCQDTDTKFYIANLHLAEKPFTPGYIYSNQPCPPNRTAKFAIKEREVQANFPQQQYRVITL